MGRKQDHLDVEFLIQEPRELSEYSISSSIDLYSCSTTLRYGEADLHINNEIIPQAMRIDFVRFWLNSSQTDDSLSHCQSRSSCFQPAKKPDVASCSLQLLDWRLPFPLSRGEDQVLNFVERRHFSSKRTMGIFYLWLDSGKNYFG